MRSPVWQVFRKEIREMFRDKRVRSAAFVMPVFLVALMLSLFGFIAQEVTRPQSQRVHVVGPDNALVEALRAKQVNVVKVETAEEGIELVRQGRARVLLEFTPESVAKIAKNQPVDIPTYLNPDQQGSQVTFGFVMEQVALLNKDAALAAILGSGLNPRSLAPVSLVREEVRVGEKKTGEFVLGILPYLIVIWAFYGGMGIVSDMVAGEKEKQTLETLLISPVRRWQIAIGKWLALSLVCLTSSVSSLVAVAALGILQLPLTKAVFEDGFNLGVAGTLQIIAVLVPTVAFFAAAMLAISAYARNMREAQTHLTLLSFLVLLPAIFSQVIGFTDLGSNRWISVVPVLNTANAVRDALMGRVDPIALSLTIGTSLLLAAGALVLTVRMFEREEVLVRV